MKPYVGHLRAFLRLRICRIHESIRSQICPKPFPGLNYISTENPGNYCLKTGP